MDINDRKNQWCQHEFRYTKAQNMQMIKFKIVLTALHKSALGALLWYCAWLFPLRLSTGQTASPNTIALQEIVDNLGVLRESVDLGRYAPGCETAIGAAIKLGPKARPLLIEGLNDKNLLKVANCSRCLIRMKEKLTENEREIVRNTKKSIIASMPNGPAWRPSTDGEYKEWIKYGEHRFAIAWLDQLLRG